MTVLEMQAQLEEMYGAEVSPTLISTVTNAVMDEAKAWQSRPFDALYPIVYLDCINVKSRYTEAVKVKAVYLALGIDLTSNKQLLGLWIAQTEGAKFSLQVVTELKNRGVQDIFIACVDGLKALLRGDRTAYTKTAVQLCVVHTVRHSLNYVSWKMRKAFAADLRSVYAAATLEAATAAPDKFELNGQLRQYIPKKRRM
jgi:putative transposase